MKNGFKYISLFALPVLFMSTASAQVIDSPYDLDKSGDLSLVEFEAAVESVFHKLDIDSNQSIDGYEFVGKINKSGKSHIDQWLLQIRMSALDLNDDERISLKEAKNKEGLHLLFKRADIDKNNVISRNEVSDLVAEKLLK